MINLETYTKIVDDPLAYGWRCHAESPKPIIGYFCSYTPEELILAAGTHPFRLFGSSRNIRLADEHIQTYSCAVVRSTLEDALNGNLSFLAGTIFPHTCDSIQRLSDIWRINVAIPFHCDIVLPVKLDTASARDYYTDALKQLKADLVKHLGSPIFDADLRQAIKKTNQIKILLKKLYELHEKNPAAPTGHELFTIMRASMIMDRDDLLADLPQLIELFNGRPAGKPAGKGKRLLLAGSVCEHPDIYPIIEEAGGHVVWDDFCSGARYFDGLIDETAEPLAAITDRYIRRVACPAKHSGLTDRADHLVSLARQKKADGVVFVLLKYCDPHAFDYPYLKAALDREGLPNLLIEVSDQLPALGQLKTRFEAFIEML
ncbi:MAG: 2-hydroxyacyl-CoA dehydratase [Deltaproteobacteria bacterium]|nr:2-hydroxyacyl-CoA dehydratase [Deltaproteobacteria bacterium]